METRLAIFDLGCVVFHVDLAGACEVWARHTSLPAAHFAVPNIDDEVHHAFERGEITARQFHRHFNELMGVDLDFDSFAAGWCAIYGPVYPQVEALLHRLRGTLGLVAYTNTNALHEPTWKARYARVLSLFDEVHISSRLGFRKPERRGFEYVLAAHGVEPAEAIFLDDAPANVAAAQELGIRAVQVLEPDDVVEAFGG